MQPQGSNLHGLRNVITNQEGGPTDRRSVGPPAWDIESFVVCLRVCLLLSEVGCLLQPDGVPAAKRWAVICGRRGIVHTAQ